MIGIVESGMSGSAEGGNGREALPPGQVDVWYLRTDAAPADCLEAMERVLSRQEIERSLRYRHARDRDLHVFGRGLTRFLLSRYALPAPADWSFAIETFGRPFIAGPSAAGTNPGLDFNVSHTPGLVAVAVGRGVRVGIDVEGDSNLFIDPVIARAILDPDEARALAALPLVARPDHLRRLWTLKEAYTKAVGAGLRSASSDIGFETDPDGSPRHRIRGPGQEDEVTDEWWFHESSLEGGFRLAIAVHAPGMPRPPLRLRAFDCARDLSTDGSAPSPTE